MRFGAAMEASSLAYSRRGMQELLNKIFCGDCIETLSKIDQPFAD